MKFIATSHSWRWRTRRCFPCLAVLLFVLVVLGAAPAQAQITISRLSSSVHYISTKFSTNNVGGMYAAYKIHNAGAAQADVWVKADNFTGGVVTLAPNEDGVVQLGALASGQYKMAYFFLGATTATTVPQTHTVTVYDTRPDLPGATALATAPFTFTEVATSISAAANKVDVVIHGPDPGTLGGVITMTVEGRTGTVGAGDNLEFSAAAQLSWPANAFHLFATQITFINIQGSNCGSTVLYSVADSLHIRRDVTSCYRAVYKFYAIGTTSTNTPVSPIVHVASGTQIKHTDASGFASLAPIKPVDNQVTLAKFADQTTLSAADTVTYTLRLSNAASNAGCPASDPTCNDVSLADFVDVLPTSPASPTYVAGSSSFAGSAIDDPSISGSTLTWVGSFSVPAGGTADLTYDVSIPNTDGDYVNSALGHVGIAQIDTTLDTSDDAPASEIVALLIDSDADGIPDSIEDANGDSDPTNDDADGDGVPNYLDIDSDNDGLTDLTEAGSTPSTPLDSDNDGLPDYLDIDSDGDGLPDNVEAQSTLGFTAPGVTFIDIDGDGLDDGFDSDLASADPTASAGLTPYDHDGDTTPDHLDPDSDNDGSSDAQEGHDYDHDGNPDKTSTGTDADADGLDDGYEHPAGYTPGHTSNPNNGITDTAIDLPDHGDPASDVDFRNDLVLPVELVSFDATLDGNNVLLDWQTASETNNAGFEIQHRSDHHTHWLVLGFVEGHGTSLIARRYRYRSADLEPGSHRFRLKQIDYDGSFTFSPEVEVFVELAEVFLVEPAYPNPFNAQTWLRFAVRRSQKVQVALYDVLGRRVRVLYAGKPLEGVYREVLIDGGDLGSGLYVVSVRGEAFVQTQKVILLK